MTGSANSRSLAPRTIQIVGLALIIGLTAFWAVTGRAEAALIVASGGLVAAGQGLQELRDALARLDRRDERKQ